MKKLVTAVALAVTASLTSCAAGPHQLSRTVDDWDQKNYVQSPWINAALQILVIPTRLGACIADFFVTDAYTFWFKDAWDGKGTGFEHYKQTWTDGRMKSMLMSDSGFIKMDMTK